MGKQMSKQHSEKQEHFLREWFEVEQVYLYMVRIGKSWRLRFVLSPLHISLLYRFSEAITPLYPMPVGRATLAQAFWREEGCASNPNVLRRSIEQACRVEQRREAVYAKSMVAVVDAQQGQAVGQGKGRKRRLREPPIQVTDFVWSRETSGEPWEEKQQRLYRLSKQLRSLLAGRSLLWHEAGALLVDSGISQHYRAQECMAAIDLGVVTGTIELSNAVCWRLENRQSQQSGHQLHHQPQTPKGRQIRGMGRREISNIWWLVSKWEALMAYSRHPMEQLACRRCGTSGKQLEWTRCALSGRLNAYCPACLTMGRSSEGGLLVSAPQRLAVQQHLRPARTDMPDTRMQEATSSGIGQDWDKGWGLSPAQRTAAFQALQFMERQWRLPAKERSRQSHWLAGGSEHAASFLLWAVTGAGKTEMVFPLLAYVLQRGGRALLATPRRDVVIELDPRLRRAFPQHALTTLHGGSDQRWERGDITLATTHQLLRFREAFDLVIIDELDAYPYHGDKQLYYAAQRCRKRGGLQLLLSATPPPALQRAARKGELAHAHVPVRYHRHPLPVPQLLRVPTAARLHAAGRLPARLRRALQKSWRRNAQIFVFVQRIADAEQVAALLARSLAAALATGAGQDAALLSSQIAATSSKDSERAEKVQRFRAGDIRLLVTTTILERGVTIPRSDIFILDADGKLFDEASLVQMAGRAGRSADDPNGLVYFCSEQRTSSQLSAIRQIKRMNKMARRAGYLLQVDAKSKDAKSEQ